MNSQARLLCQLVEGVWWGTWRQCQGRGVNRGIQIRRSAQILSKIRDLTMALSKFESAKSTTMKSQPRIRTKLQAKSTVRAKILDKFGIRCIYKIRKSMWIIRQIRNPNNFFCEIRRWENLFTPPPPVSSLVSGVVSGPERTYPNLVSIAIWPCSPRLTLPETICQKKSAPINIWISECSWPSLPEKQMTSIASWICKVEIS